MTTQGVALSSLTGIPLTCVRQSTTSANEQWVKSADFPRARADSFPTSGKIFLNVRDEKANLENLGDENLGDDARKFV
jgi:hypothetical protein